VAGLLLSSVPLSEVLDGGWLLVEGVGVVDGVGVADGVADGVGVGVGRRCCVVGAALVVGAPPPSCGAYARGAT
jgi:hypothetical protein